jgi:hypothetical protein
MRRAALVLGLLLPGAAHAAAWTQRHGEWQAIAGTIFSDATHSYDNGGSASYPERFQRLLFTSDTEYGLTDRVTLLLRTETANVHLRNAGVLTNALDNAVEGGVRWRMARPHWLAQDDVLSLEVTGRKAGAFNFAYSANANAGGEDAGARLLYGSGFKLFRRNAFIDLEAGYRWVSMPRPDQFVADATGGLWLTPRWMLMLQSFNMVSGAATLPYVPFRIHKLEASLVWRVSRRLSLQGGAFFTPMGRNALDERGVQLSLWSNF